MIVVIVGAAGFVGSALLRNKFFFNSVMIDPRCSVAEKKGQVLIKKDMALVTDGELPNEDFVVVNAGAQLGTRDKLLNENNNVNALKAFLVTLERSSFCKGILHFSSVSAARGKSAYGLTKLAGEKLVEESSIPHTILRSEMIIGEGARSVEKIKKLSNALPFFVFLPKGGKVTRYPIDIEQVVLAVASIIKSNHFHNRRYELVGDAPVSLNNLVKRYTNKMVIPIPCSIFLLCAFIMELLIKFPPITLDNAHGAIADTELHHERFEMDRMSPVSLS